MRALLSVLILFHLVCIGMAPNRETGLGRMMNPVLEAYLRTIELTSAWGFFSPDPGPPPVFFEWEVLGREGEAIETGKWPREFTGFSFRSDRQYRHATLASYLVGSDVLAEQMMVPYLCGKYPQANSLQLWRVLRSVPSREDVLQGKRKIGDDVGQDRRSVSHNFCQRPG